MSVVSHLLVLSCVVIFCTYVNGVSDFSSQTGIPINDPNIPIDGILPNDNSSTEMTDEENNMPKLSLIRNMGRAFKKAFKKVAKAVKRFVCENVCPLLCSDVFGYYTCMFRCDRVCCDRVCSRTKRSISKSHEGHLTPLPNSFSAYDLNDNNVVSLKELAFAAGHNVTQDDLFTVFEMTDKNGDKSLTPQELYEGPFVFEMDVSDDNYVFCKYRDIRMNRHRQSTTRELLSTPEDQ